jgi:hypothetical protein
MANNPLPNAPGELLFYQTEDGRTRLHVRMEGETVGLSQRDMAELFQTSKQNVSLHIQNIFDERGIDLGDNGQGIFDGSNRRLQADRSERRTPQARRHHLRRLPRQVPGARDGRVARAR